VSNRLELIQGGGDIVKALEHLLEEARQGRVVGVVLCAISDRDDGTFHGWTWAHKDGVVAPWARLHAVAADAAHHLMKDGLT